MGERAEKAVLNDGRNGVGGQGGQIGARPQDVEVRQESSVQHWAGHGGPRGITGRWEACSRAKRWMPLVPHRGQRVRSMPQSSSSTVRQSLAGRTSSGIGVD